MLEYLPCQKPEFEAILATLQKGGASLFINKVRDNEVFKDVSHKLSPSFYAEKIKSKLTELGHNAHAQKISPNSFDRFINDYWPN